MRTPLFSLYLLLLLIPVSMYAQDQLKINIASMGANPVVTLSFNNASLSEASLNQLALKGDSLSVDITSNVPDAIVKLQRNTLPIELTDPLTGFPMHLSIRNDTLQHGSFFLGSKFSIKIMSADLANSKDIKINTSKIADDQQTSNNGATAPAVTGSAVIDALTLSDEKTTNQVKSKILSYYAFGKNSADPLSKQYEGNPFMTGSASKMKDIINAQADLGAVFSSVLTSAGGLDVTKIADGLAIFLVKRTKEELGITFFSKFKEVLNKPEYADLKTLFPQTYTLLQSIDENIYDYQRYLQNLREGFKADINLLNKNLPGIIDNHPVFFSKHQEWAMALRSACYVAGELDNKTHPADILANYPVQYLDNVNINYKGAIQTLQLISASLHDTARAENAPYWVNIGKIRELVNNKETFRIYLGLLYQQAKFQYDNIKFESTSLVALLDKVAAEYDSKIEVYNAYKAYVLGFGDKASALSNLLSNQDKAAGDSAKVELYTRYFKSAVELLDYSTGIADLPYIKEQAWAGTLKLKLRKYFEINYSTAALVSNINSRNYPAAINNTIEIYRLVTINPVNTGTTSAISFPSKLAGNATKEDTQRIQQALQTTLAPYLNTANVLSKSEKDNLINEFTEQVKKAAGKDKLPEETISKIKAILNDEINSTAVLSKLSYYGGFMSAIATAKTSEEVSVVIETYALPTGSSRIKRTTAFNVSLNAYVGLFAGAEKINGVDEKYKVNSYGVTAPIGIAISLGHGRFRAGKPRTSSSSLFFSIIDLGAVTSFRFTNDSTEKVPTIQLKDIISPGIFYSFGIGKTPLSVNVGYQSGPLLRKVNVSNNDYSKSYGRFSVSVCVDIPMLNFYTNTGRK